MAAQVEFCGEMYELDASRPFYVGRDADLVVDDNPFLHRRFLQFDRSNGFWWIANVGSRLAATVSDIEGRMQAWLAPEARLPIVFPQISILFTAGPTTYEVEFSTDEAVYTPPAVDEPSDGTTTTGRATLTPDQRLLLLALAEPMLRRGVRGAASVPASSEVASRLGWTLTKLNRKLDSVCEKLERIGVAGLHGGPERLAVNRKARLAEYALAARLVRQEDLPLLDGERRSDEEAP